MNFWSKLKFRLKISGNYSIIESGIKYTVIIANNKDIIWTANNNIHRINGPAATYCNGNQEWYFNNQLYREDGPAEITADGDQYWYFHGKYHRADGPAVIKHYGTEEWWYDGKLHRTDGPAFISGPYYAWFLHGKLHREDGPTLYYKNESNRADWYYHNERIKVSSQEEFEQWKKMKIFN